MSAEHSYTVPDDSRGDMEPTQPSGHGDPSLNDLAPLRMLWGKIREREDWTDAERQDVLDEDRKSTRLNPVTC